jgi:hypothetical protein
LPSISSVEETTDKLVEKNLILKGPVFVCADVNKSPGVYERHQYGSCY